WMRRTSSNGPRQMAAQGEPSTSGNPADDDSGYPRRSYAWTVVAILVGTAILSYTDRQVLSLLVDPIRRDLLISDTEVSLLLGTALDRKSTRLNSSHLVISYAVFCLKKKNIPLSYPYLLESN